MIYYEVTTDRWSSVVDMKYTDAKGKLFEERKVFLNPNEATIYLSQHLHDYIFTRLRRYIMHCWLLGKNSCHYAYSTEARIIAIKYLLDQVFIIKSYNVLGLARWININYSFLEKVLPHYQNISFQSSKRTIEELLRLAKVLAPDDQRRG